MGDPMERRALVLFSGGQDSATCVAWALERYAHVETIGFNYGQRHSVELECRKAVLNRMKTLFTGWAAGLGADHMLDLALLGQISDTALTQDQRLRSRRPAFLPPSCLLETCCSSRSLRRSLTGAG